MLPPHQSLETDESTAYQVYLRLIVKTKLTFIESQPQIRLEGQTLLGARRQLGGKEAQDTTSLLLGLMESRTGAAQQCLGVSPVGWE
jgi:hypothetical protein